MNSKFKFLQCKRNAKNNKDYGVALYRKKKIFIVNLNLNFKLNFVFYFKGP